MLRRLWIGILWRIRRTASEDKAGIYITVIIHLTVIIVLMLASIHTEISKETSFLMDFSGMEEKEEQERIEEFRESISRRIDEMLNTPASSGEEIRNIAVDARAKLKDDRNTDAEKLYEDAEKLDKTLRTGNRHAIEEDARNEAVDLGGKEQESGGKKEYSGPSVLSYSLDGRKASHLRIPAYRCYSGGEVTVIITVDPSGRVMNAKVLDDISSSDKCLREFAIRAARLSRFSASPSAPARQTGEIVYRFMAQ